MARQRSVRCGRRSIPKRGSWRFCGGRGGRSVYLVRANRTIDVIDGNAVGEPVGAPRIVVPTSTLEGMRDRYRSELRGVVAQPAPCPSAGRVVSILDCLSRLHRLRREVARRGCRGRGVVQSMGRDAGVAGECCGGGGTRRTRLHSAGHDTGLSHALVRWCVSLQGIASMVVLYSLTCLLVVFPVRYRMVVSPDNLPSRRRANILPASTENTKKPRSVPDRLTDTRTGRPGIGCSENCVI